VLKTDKKKDETFSSIFKTCAAKSYTSASAAGTFFCRIRHFFRVKKGPENGLFKPFPASFSDD
jgi:hypothetical protein